MKNQYDDYDRSGKNSNFSTMGRRGDYTSQAQVIQEEISNYNIPFDNYRQSQDFIQDHDNQNAAQKSSPGEFEIRYSKGSYNQDYDEVEADMRNVEDIQNQLHEMDISDKNPNK
jgi:hypothetical protein